MLDSDSNYLLTQQQLESDEVNKFSSSMILSDEAKKFAIAREVQRSITQPHLMVGAITSVFTLLTYNTARVLNRKLGLFRQPPLIRGIMYLGLLPTMMLSYVLIKDAYNRMAERDLERRTSSISSEYAKGGVEYYEKMLQRNIALRELVGPGGKDQYTGTGDLVQGIIRIKRVSLQEKKDLCRSYAATY